MGNDLLTSCTACGNEISVRAESCPKCGEPRPENPVENGPPLAVKLFLSFLFTILGVLLFLGIVGYIVGGFIRT